MKVWRRNLKINNNASAIWLQLIFCLLNTFLSSAFSHHVCVFSICCCYFPLQKKHRKSAASSECVQCTDISKYQRVSPSLSSSCYVSLVCAFYCVWEMTNILLFSIPLFTFIKLHSRQTINAIYSINIIVNILNIIEREWAFTVTCVEYLS